MDFVNVSHLAFKKPTGVGKPEASVAFCGLDLLI